MTSTVMTSTAGAEAEDAETDRVVPERRPAYLVPPRDCENRMLSRLAVAQQLGISLEMASRHGLPRQMNEAEVAAIEQNPPAWLLQSRANRVAGGRPVWVTLTCVVCGFEETMRPKKWWPEFDFVVCDHHPVNELPVFETGTRPFETPGIGSRFIGVEQRN